MKVKFSFRCLTSTFLLPLLAWASHPGPGKHPQGFLHPAPLQHWITSNRNGVRIEQPVPSSPCSLARPRFPVPQFMVPFTSHYAPGCHTQSPSAFSIFNVCWRCCSPSGARFDSAFLTSAELFPLVRWGSPNHCFAALDGKSHLTTRFCRAPAA